MLNTVWEAVLTRTGQHMYNSASKIHADGKAMINIYIIIQLLLCNVFSKSYYF